MFSIFKLKKRAQDSQNMLSQAPVIIRKRKNSVNNDNSGNNDYNKTFTFQQEKEPVANLQKKLIEQQHIFNEASLGSKNPLELTPRFQNQSQNDPFDFFYFQPGFMDEFN